MYRLLAQSFTAGVLLVSLLAGAAVSAQSQRTTTKSQPSLKGAPSNPSRSRKVPAMSDESKIKPQGEADKTQSSSTRSTPVKDDEVITVDTNLVTTPVSVLDRNGRFIAGLKKKDFKIFEDGKPQKITYFQSEEQPFTVILMIDASPSTKYKIDEIHYAAVTFVNQLRPNDKVMVVAFDQRVRVLTPEPTSNHRELFAAIYKAQFGSGTSLYDAVDAIVGLDLLKIPGRKAIVLFTDGVDTTSRRSDFQSSLAAVEETDALIYTIRYNTMERDPNAQATSTINLSDLIARYPGIQIPPGTVIRAGRGQSEGEYKKGQIYLESLSYYTGGRTFEADSITNLEASFSGVAEELRRQYSVGYYPDDTGQAGDRRKIKVQVTRPNAVIRAKPSYIIGSNRGADDGR